MKQSLFIFPILICLLAFSCANEFNVKYDKDSSRNFTNYKTYAWAAPGDTILTMIRNDKLFAGTIHLYANEELKGTSKNSISFYPCRWLGRHFPSPATRFARGETGLPSQRHGMRY